LQPTVNKVNFFLPFLKLM